MSDIMKVHGLHHANLRIHHRQIGEVRNFYCDVLDLREGWRPPFKAKGYWLYAGTDAVVHLVETQGEERRVSDNNTSPVDHVAFRCSGLQATLAKLDRLGIPYERSGVPETRITQLFLRDPLGTGVELSFDPD